MICKNEKCKKELEGKFPLHFSNKHARLNGYCGFMCLSEDLGREKAFETLQNAENKGNTVNRV